MFQTTLFAAINAASTVICSDYEIDNFDFTSHPGIVRMDCGRDHTVALFKDGPVQIEDDGTCMLMTYSGPEAEGASLGEGLALLQFRVHAPLTEAYLNA